MSRTFARLAPRLQQAIVARLGWSSLRAVQEQAGEALLDGHNAVILAPTAGGKTEAAMFPTLSMMVERPPEGVAALYVAPIKALLNNQAHRLGLYTEMVGLDRFVWHGDTTPGAKRAFVREPAPLLMTTPESLEVMLASSKVPARRLFADLRIVVIDEVHALAGTDRGAHFLSVVERLAELSRHDVQRVGLSATVGNPPQILTWLTGSSQRRGVVVDPPKAPQRRELLIHYDEDESVLADLAARRALGMKSLFFCESRAMTEQAAERMRRRGVTVFVHHSSVSQEEREEAEKRFHHGSNTCIACTSTLELGIDVGDLDRVLQYEAPSTVSAFLQRMGRTGRRAETHANMTFYTTSPESLLQAAALIHLARQGWVEDVKVQTRCWPVVVHQLLALCLAQGAVNIESFWSHLQRVPDFRGIERAEFDAVIRHMVAEGFLFAVDGLYAMGDRAERVFGRRNFMELYAVFSTPQLYTVCTRDGKPLGSLEQEFVDNLAVEASAFLLAGRAWIVEAIDHKGREVRVHTAPRGKKPTWGGMTPRFLSRPICEAMRHILQSTDPVLGLSPAATERMDAWRDYLADLLDTSPCPIVDAEDGLRWWTFAGGRINTTLKYALEAQLGCRVTTDNLSLRIISRDLSRITFREALADLADPKVWHDGLEDTVRARCPAFRLSKFQPALPEWAQREVIESAMLDLAGAWGVLGTTMRRAGVLA